jgi:hypothetical protein
MDTKYGRIFTEDDVVAMVVQATHDMAGVDRGMSEDQARPPNAGYPAKIDPLEPVFMLRGQDKAALGTVTAYRGLAEEEGASDEVLDSIDGAIEGFREFAYANPDKMKVAD